MLSILVLCLAFSTTFAGFSKRNVPNPPPPRVSDVNPAVFVSPYLPDQADVARNLSQVHLPGWNQPNYAAFITIDKSTNSNHFFWFFESLDGNQNAPILVWLQGGPGVSSMFGLFTEIGPFNIDANMKIAPRAINWNQHYHLLFIDNPLGTGFSFTESESAYVTNETQVGANLYKVILQFFQLFPNLKANPFYITGESYAGKYVPAFGYTVHTQNQVAPPESKVNFKGIAIGDGALEPSQQFHGFGDLLYYLGMVNDNERRQFYTYEIDMQTKLRQGDVVGAFQIFDEMLNGDFYPYPTYYANVTGMATNYFNFELAPDAASITNNYFINWLATPEARNAIHVGAYPFNVYNSSVEKHLQFDWMVGVVPFLVPLMENYKVLIYNGQNDVILGPPLTENFLRQLQWRGQQEYLNAPKKLWKIDLGAGRTDLAGYVRTVGSFAQVVVRGAGHMVPGDQPLRGYDLITRFVSGTL